MRRTAMMLAMMTTMAGAAPPAHGQLLGGLPVARPLGDVTGALLGNPDTRSTAGVAAPLDRLRTAVPGASPASLVSLRRDRLRQLVRANRAVLELDRAGNPIRRDIVVGIDLTATSLAAAQAAGFRLVATEQAGPLGLSATTLAPPRGRSAEQALERLRSLDPAGAYTLDHVYQPAGGALLAQRGDAPGGAATMQAIGLIDGGVGVHPAFSRARIEQRGFAGAARPSGHGTAVASLLVGSAGAFRGAAADTALLVADVYGGSAANGSATAIVRAMAWLAQRRVRVVNVSLVGPANPLLAAATRALTSRGIMVVAAVGNDGPAAPPQYPASYPEVIAVTGVDARGRALLEAGRAAHLDFAAPGADMVGAVPGGGWDTLRGTSFAAPLVAARIAARGSVAALRDEAGPGIGRVGRGIVCGTCRTPPRALGIK